jgi:hypothetical protein
MGQLSQLQLGSMAVLGNVWGSSKNNPLRQGLINALQALYVNLISRQGVSPAQAASNFQAYVAGMEQDWEQGGANRKSVLVKLHTLAVN